MKQGLESYQRGDFEKAVLSWTEAAQLYEKEERPDEQTQALVKLAQAYQSIGRYKKAQEHLEAAQAIAEKSGNERTMTYVLGGLGNVYLATGPLETARKYLNEALALAEELGNTPFAAVILNNLGNLLSAQKTYMEAVDSYRRCVALADKAGNPSLVGTALANAARAALKSKQYEEARAFLDKALTKLRATTHSHQKAYGLINVGLACYELRKYLPDSRDALILLASDTLHEAAVAAQAIGDFRAASYAWGHLGRFYEDENRHEEALQLTRRATLSAQQVEAPESLYQWQWQTGRLLKALGQTDDAISAYRRAVGSLQSIRQEISTTYGGERLSFRQSIGPLYFELVDLLLRRTDGMKERAEYEAYLIEAREKIEWLKIAELRDYFRDDCVDAAQAKIRSLDIFSQTAAIVYPVLLEDRIELLVSLPTGLERFTVPVGAGAVAKEVRAFRTTLEVRATREYLPHAQKLYDWLVGPLEPDLASFMLDTLVFVPDGPLRTIPMGALHDGKHLLIEKYSLAVTPGLNLTDPRPISREKVKVLAVGLTEASQGFPPLPSVAKELEAIQGLYDAKTLVNEAFLRSNFEKTLLDEPFNIVHIASHGQFTGNVKKTFILTFDEKLTMDQIDQCIGFLRFREEPLELLTLSACQTAVGDDRAALGLAGIAVRAGARSAVATLWSIHDEATAILVSEFYRQLKDPSLSRATALQRAQLRLAKDPKYEHPYYWSAFLLINNWL